MMAQQEILAQKALQVSKDSPEQPVPLVRMALLDQLVLPVFQAHEVRWGCPESLVLPDHLDCLDLEERPVIVGTSENEVNLANKVHKVILGPLENLENEEQRETRALLACLARRDYRVTKETRDQKVSLGEQENQERREARELLELQVPWDQMEYQDYRDQLGSLEDVAWLAPKAPLVQLDPRVTEEPPEIEANKELLEKMVYLDLMDRLDHQVHQEKMVSQETWDFQAHRAKMVTEARMVSKDPKDL